MNPFGFMIFASSALAIGSVAGTGSDSNTNKFIDLTYAFRADNPTWPGRKPTFNVEFEGYTHAGYWLDCEL
jgi:hypothetical protein